MADSSETLLEMNTSTSDPALYRQLSEPRESEELAKKDVLAFMQAVFELRKTYRLPEVLVTVGVSVTQLDGSEKRLIYSGSRGSGSVAEEIIAALFSATRVGKALETMWIEWARISR